MIDIKIKILGKEISLEEAKTIYRELNEVFGERDGPSIYPRTYPVKQNPLRPNPYATGGANAIWLVDYINPPATW